MGPPDLLTPHLAYLKDSNDAGCATDDWVLILPQTSGPTSVAGATLGVQPLTLVQRKRNARGVFNHISGVSHRQSAERITGSRPLCDDDPFATQFHRPRRGVVLLYPVVAPDLDDPTDQVAHSSIDPAKVVMAMAFIPAVVPIGRSAPCLHFRVVKSRQIESPIVGVHAER